MSVVYRSEFRGGGASIFCVNFITLKVYEIAKKTALKLTTKSRQPCDLICVKLSLHRKLILQMCGWLPIANDTTNINSTVNTSSREHHSSTRGGGGNGGDTPNNLLNITTSVTSPAGEKMNSQIVHDYVKTCDEVEVSIERLCTLAIWSFDLTFAIKLLRDHMMTTDKGELLFLFGLKSGLASRALRCSYFFSKIVC